MLDLFDHPMHPYTRGLLRCIPRMGSRTARLVTVREVVDDPAEFTRLPRAREGVRPWWPEHDAPADTVFRDEPPNNYALIEASPDHWVGVWNTRAVAGERQRAPELGVRAAVG
ncbi:MAG TPA: hypothetical protein DEB06_05045, partial [Phycisphaerales bacterium]|nr:hypothetical protein [Phycisphaerales bacterium]